MIERNSRLVRELDSVLREELRLQKEYAEILNEERTSITTFKAEKVQSLSEKREVLSETIKRAAEKRAELMAMFPEHQGKRLSELIRAHCHPVDQERLMPLADALKLAVQNTKSLSTEFKQLASFSLNLVNGALSILWSATQNVTRSYTPNGKIKESAHSSGNRQAGVLKEA
ncbi:MAG: flagellar export chaperone FlgN [Deltaproteobacteria bacterium]|nr:flagellar export chaperone FlgN [Deltaproteobacteria bacterium]